MTEKRPLERPIAGNTATNGLKVLALVFMICDHVGKMLLPGVPELRILGRIAFPLYCWCLVVGFHYTRSPAKYCLRLLLIGLISQPLYMIALNHTWREPNIMLTLLLGLLALWGLREKRFGSQIWAPLAALALAVIFNANYNWRGVLLILLLWAAQERRTGIAAVMIAFCLFWGSTSTVVQGLFGLSFRDLSALPTLNALLTPWLKLQALAVLALPFILLQMRQNIRMPKWLGYAAYPGHLLLLWLAELLVNQQGTLERAIRVLGLPGA